MVIVPLWTGVATGHVGSIGAFSLDPMVQIATIPPLTVGNSGLIAYTVMNNQPINGFGSGLNVSFGGNALGGVSGQVNTYSQGMGWSFDPSLFSGGCIVRAGWRNLASPAMTNIDWALVIAVYDKDIGLATPDEIPGSTFGPGVTLESPPSSVRTNIYTFNSGSTIAPGRQSDPFWTSNPVHVGMTGSSYSNVPVTTGAQDTSGFFNGLPAQDEGIVYIGQAKIGSTSAQLWIYDPPSLMTLDPQFNPPDPVFLISDVPNTHFEWHAHTIYGSVPPVYPKGRTYMQIVG